MPNDDEKSFSSFADNLFGFVEFHFTNEVEPFVTGKLFHLNVCVSWKLLSDENETRDSPADWANF